MRTQTLSAILFGLAAASCFAQTVDLPGVHIGPGGVTVHGKKGTAVINNGGVSTGHKGRRAAVLAHGARPAASGKTLTITASGQTRTYICSHSDLELTGSANRLTLKGTCGTVTVSGSKNRIRVVGTADRVVMTGSGNVVTWTKKNPHGTPIEDTGPNNSAAYKP